MDPFEQLFTQQQASSVGPDMLEMLGRQASQLFQQRGIPLNEAIVQVVADHPELNNEHLRRVVEFANTVTFQEIFQSSSDKNVHFDVADPGVILRDLKDGGTPSHDGKPLGSSMNDYMSPVRQAGSSQVDQLIGQQFSQDNPGYADTAKIASVTDHGSHANPIDDIHDLRIRTEATRDALVEAHEMYDRLLKTAKAELHQQVKNEILDPDGSGLGGVLDVVEKIASDHAEMLIGPIVASLLNEGVSPELLNESMEKKAGEVVNMEHPVIAMVDAIVKIAKDLTVTDLAIDEMNQSLQEIDEFYKSAGALTTGVKQAVGMKGRVPSGLRQRFPR